MCPVTKRDVLLFVSSCILRCAIACVDFHVEGENVLFGVIFFLVVSRARVHFCCSPLIVWLALIVCDVALVLCASSFVQKSLFG